MSVADFTKAMTEYQDGTRTKDAKMAKAAKKMTAADVANGCVLREAAEVSRPFLRG